jgi:uncharacterized membrane protein
MARHHHGQPALLQRPLSTLLRMRGVWVSAYLAVAGPALLVLCVLTGPFQVPDERAHFLRAVQIAGGELVPRLAPGGGASGGKVEAGAIAVSDRFATIGDNLDPAQKFSRKEIGELLAMPAAEPAFGVFSNTAIYFPSAYIVPALAMLPLRAAGAPPLAWLYAGRLANALAALAVTAVVLARIRHGHMAVFAAALLPMTLFETASLAPDALLLPAAMVVAWQLAALIEDGRLGARQACLLGAAAIHLAVSKFAYLPLALIAPAVALLGRRTPSRDTGILVASALAALLVFAGWSWLVSDQAFPGPGREEASWQVDIHGQLHRLLADPLAFVPVLAQTLSRNAGYYAGGLAGRHLGWGEIKLPIMLTVASLAMVALTSVVGERDWRPGWKVTSIALTGVAGSLLAVFLLLYLQFSPLGAPEVHGVQGRYFLPFLPLLAVVLPGWRPRGAGTEYLALALLAWGLVSAQTTVNYVVLRYWPM